MSLVEGLAGIAVGLIAVLWLDITALALLAVIGVWAIATGILEVVATIRMLRAIAGEWLLGLSGILSVVLGLIVIARPGAGAVVVAWLIGAYAVMFGALLLALAFRLRGPQEQGHMPSPS